MSDLSRSESPGRLAWLRLRANAMAMVALAVLVVVVLATVATPLVVRQDPDRQHPWIGAQPPGTSHPDVAPHNRFALGAEPEIPESLHRADHLRLVVREQASEEIRVSLRRGQVALIQAYPGPRLLETLDLAGHEVVSVDAKGRERILTVADAVRSGEEPPAGLFAAGERALILRLRGSAEERVYDITLSDGRCATIAGPDGPLERLAVAGPDVVSIHADGVERRLVHRLGTDAVGRDVLARVLHGGRISLLVGLVATMVSLIIGVVYGAIAGFRGGRVDRAMMSSVDVLYALPFMFLVILLMTLFERSLLLLFVALGAVQWLTMARIVRAQVLAMAGSEFIAAATLSGASGWRILWRHLIPNCTGPVIVYATLTVPTVIMEESFLAFLGLGVGFQGSDVESWGSLVHAGAQATNHPWLLIVPATAMAVTLLALNILGDGLRDALDPKLEGR